MDKMSRIDELFFKGKNVSIFHHQIIIPFQTLLTDQSRLQKLQQRLNEQRLVAYLMLIICNIGGATLSSLPDFCDKVKRVIMVLLEGMNDK